MSALIIAGAAFVGWFLVPVLLKATLLRPSSCKSKKRLDGKVVLVTGANTGLGKVTAADLSARGAVVYMACRSMTKAETAKQDILKHNPNAKLRLIHLDLNSLKSVKACVDEFLKENSQLDILVANAGFGSFKHGLTEDGIEWHLGCNHLAHFYLVRLLLPALDKAGNSSEKSRIVVVSSYAYLQASKGIQYELLQEGKSYFTYGQSKLANILFSNSLSQRLGGRNITVNSLHPGIVKTEFTRNYIPINPMLGSILSWFVFPGKYLSLTEVEGTQTQLWAAVSADLEGVSGKFLDNCRIKKTNNKLVNDEEAEKLWKWSCEKMGLSLDLQ